MKIKKHIIILIIAIFWLSCQLKESNSKKSAIEESLPIAESALQNSHSNKINIEEELQIEFGDYFMALKNSNLSLCCIDSLYNPFMSFDNQSIREILKGFEESKDKNSISFKMKNSQIKLIEWNSEETNEYRIFFGNSIFIEPDIEFPNGIKIGMTKKEIMSKIFVFDEYLFDEIKQISVCEDELGEGYTKYKFSNNKLIEIEFGNHSEN